LFPYTTLFRSHQLIPVIGGPTDAVAPDSVAVEATVSEVATGTTGIGCGQKPLVIPVDRGDKGLSQAPTRLAALALVAVGVAQADPETAGEGFDRRLEVEMCDVANEVDDIASGLASEAVVDAFELVHRERWCPLTVEGTEAHPVLSATAQLGVGRDDRDDIGALSHFCDVFVDDPQGSEAGMSVVHRP